MKTNPELEHETESFRQTWISHLEESLRAYNSGKSPGVSTWEGFDACRELSESANLWIVLPTVEPDLKDVTFPYLTQKLSREVYLYKWYAEKVAPINLGFKKAINALSLALSKLKRVEAAESVGVAELKSALQRCSSLIEKTVDAIKKERESFWRGVLATPAERSTWHIFIEKDRVRSIPPDELTQLEQLFENAKYSKSLVKRIDLDRRFQVRVATILRSYLPQEIHRLPVSPVLREAFGPDWGVELPVSLRTIARLTVLTYVAGNLGREDNNGNLLFRGRKKPINVGSVDQIIRKAGLKGL